MAYFGLMIKAKITVDISQVVVACCYVNVKFTINLSSNDQGLFIASFCLVTLAKAKVNISQIAVATVVATTACSSPRLISFLMSRAF